MRALITGGAGFIGSHLAEKLLQENYTVIVMDNLYTGSLSNIAHLMDNERFTFLEHDVREATTLQVDKIYHLACPASPVHYARDPIFTMTTNIQGTHNMLELARKTQAKMLFTSTSEVYGDPEVHPQTEAYLGNVNSIGPRACYDEGKRAAETLCFDYLRMHNIEIKLVRIFNTYGPRMHAEDGRVISTFIAKGLKGESLPIYGDGSQTRSFCYVEDLVGGLICMMDSPREITGPINLGNPHELTVRAIAEKIQEVTGNANKIVYLHAREDDPKRRCPDISQAHEVLAWQPKIQLDEGLQKTVRFFETE